MHNTAVEQRGRLCPKSSHASGICFNSIKFSSQYWLYYAEIASMRKANVTQY